MKLLLEEMPKAAWYVIAAAVILCLLLITATFVTVEQRKADALDEACLKCAERLNQCAIMVNGFNNPVIDLNNLGQDI